MTCPAGTYPSGTYPAWECPHSNANYAIHGDSFSAGISGWIGDTLRLYTSEVYRRTLSATGGENLGEIKTGFDAEFPGANDSAVIIQGGVNDIISDFRTLAQMQADMSGMADAVIAEGKTQLILLNVGPAGNAGGWNTTKQEQIEAYNAWLSATYPQYVIDIYSLLGDSAEPHKLRDIYRKNASDLHPSRNGDVIIDQAIGDHLFYRDPLGSVTPDAGNLQLNPVDFEDWTLTKLAGIGGGPIIRADGTTSTTRGLIGGSISGTQHMKMASDTITPSITVEASCLIKPGEEQFMRMQYKNNDATLSGGEINQYFDLLNIDVGTPTGSGTPISTACEKYANGWIKCSITCDSGSDGKANLLTIGPAGTISTASTTGDDVTPAIYADLAQIVPV